MGALPAAFPNDIEGRSVIAVGTILDAAVPTAFSAMVHLLGHHHTPRGRASAQQTTHGRQPDESGTRPYSGLSVLLFQVVMNDERRILNKALLSTLKNSIIISLFSVFYWAFSARIKVSNKD